MDGKRFIDEGADYRNHTYAKYGKEVMKQPGRAAVQIFDAKTMHLLEPRYSSSEPFRSDTLEGLVKHNGPLLTRSGRPVKAEVPRHRPATAE